MENLDAIPVFLRTFLAIVRKRTRAVRGCVASRSKEAAGVEDGFKAAEPRGE